MKDKKIKALLKNVYNKIAYDFTASRAHMEEDFEVLKPYFKKSSFILDLGCGSGRLAKYLKKNRIKTDYLGIDNSESLIKIAKINNSGANFEVGDIETFSLKGKNPDLIVCFRAFHHLSTEKSRKKCLKNMQKHVSKKGNIIITVWNLWQKDFKKKYSKQIFTALIRSIFTFGFYKYNDLFIPWNNNDKRYYHAFTPLELKRLIKKVNFKNVNLFGISKNGLTKPAEGKDLLVTAKPYDKTI